MSPTGNSIQIPVHSRLLNLMVDIGCLILAAVPAASLCRVVSVFRRNPFGWSDTAELGVALLCAFAGWGFFRSVSALFLKGGLMRITPGLVAWWLVGGVWVTAAAADIVVEGSSHEGNAVFTILALGTMLAGPMVLILVIHALSRPERVVADWRAWLGVAAAIIYPIHVVLFLVFRD